MMNRTLGRCLAFTTLVLVQACTSTAGTPPSAGSPVTGWGQSGGRSQSGQVLSSFSDDLKLHTNLGVGYRSVDHRDAAYGDQIAYGIEIDLYRPKDWFGTEVGFTFVTDEIDITGGQQTSDFYEVYLGIRKTFGGVDAVIHPYVSAGGNLINEEINYSPQDPNADSRATGFGGYARAGAYWRIADIDFDQNTEVVMGVDVRGVLHEDTDFVQAMIWFGAGR